MRDKAKERKNYYIVIFLLAFFYATVTYILSSHLFVWGGSDIQVHTNAIIETWETEGFFPFFCRLPYFGWHALVMFFLAFGVSPLVAASATNALLNFATALIASLIVSELAGSKSLTIAAVVLVSLFVSAIWIPAFNPEVYLGQGSPNVWNNPTYFAVRPFALLTTWFFIRAAENAFDDSRQCALLGVLVLLGVIAKPTFFQAFVPASIVFYLCGKAAGSAWGMPNWKNVAMIFLPAVVLAIVEFAILFFVPSSAAGSNNGGGFAITLFEGWSKYTPNPVVSILILLAFPIYSSYVNRKELLRPGSPYLILTLMLLVSLLEVLLVVETGAREGHGNFAWALYGSVFLYWVFSIGLYSKKWIAGELSVSQKCLGATLITLHLLSGVYYFMHLLLTGAPY